MIAKQKKLIIALAVVFCLLLGAYFAVVVPIVNKEEPEETTEPIETTDGEVIGASDRILMFEHTERANIQSIEVHNEYGDFKFYKDNNAFKIEGHEDVTIEAELFSSFITSCGYTLSLSRIDEPEELFEYGLDDAPVWYTLTTTDGVKHTVYIGDQTISEDGYYARYEGRDSVYILDATIADTVLRPVENMVTPLLCYYEYSVEKKLTYFNFFRGEDLYFRLEALSSEEEVDIEAMATYKMTYPTSYVPSENCDSIFQSLASFVGTKTVALGTTDEDFEKYGLKDPKYQMLFEVDGVEHMLLVSERQADGTYYVGSGLFDLIAQVDAETLAFVEQDLIKWVSPYIFRMSIDAVDTLEIRSADGFTETFKIEGTGDTLTVQTLSNGAFVDVLNFKSLYKTLLTIGIEGDPKFDDAGKEAASADANHYMTMKVKTRSGLERIYVFYRYSDRRSFLEINGTGDFYVLHNIVAKIRNDAEKVVKGETVDHEAKYD